VTTPEFESILHSSGYKLTIQRRALLENIQKKKEHHLCPEEIFVEVGKTCPGIGLATIYRNLQLFEKLDLIQHVSLGDGYTRYQVVDSPRRHRHHHLICEVCGEVVDVKKDMLKPIEEELSRETGFTIRDHKVQFYGVCHKCAQKNIRQKQEEK